MSEQVQSVIAAASGRLQAMRTKIAEDTATITDLTSQVSEKSTQLSAANDDITALITFVESI